MSSKIEYLNLNGAGTISEKVPCDFCNVGNTTQHICRQTDNDGIRAIVSLDKTKAPIVVCGLTTCVDCLLKYGIEGSSRNKFYYTLIATSHP